MGVPLPLPQEPELYGLGKADAQVFTPNTDFADHLLQKDLIRQQEIESDKKQKEREAETERRNMQRDLMQLNPKNVPVEFTKPIADESSSISQEVNKRYAKDHLNHFSDPDILDRRNAMTTLSSQGTVHFNKANYINKQIEKKGADFFTPDSRDAWNNRYKKEDGTTMSPQEMLDVNLEDKAPQEAIDPVHEAVTKGGIKMGHNVTRQGNMLVDQWDTAGFNNGLHAQLGSERVMQGMRQRGLKLDPNLFVHPGPNGMEPINPDDDNEVNIVTKNILSHPDIASKYGIDPTDPTAINQVSGLVREQAGIVKNYFMRGSEYGKSGIRGEKLAPDVPYVETVRHHKEVESQGKQRFNLSNEIFNYKKDNKIAADNKTNNIVESRKNLIGDYISGTGDARDQVDKSFRAAGTEVYHDEKGLVHLKIPNGSNGFIKTVIDLSHPGAGQAINTAMGKSLPAKKISGDEYNAALHTKASAPALAQGSFYGIPHEKALKLKALGPP